MTDINEIYTKQITAVLQVLHVAKRWKKDNLPCQIEEGLFLGSLGAAYNKEGLKSLNVTHILTVANAPTPAYPNDFVYKKIAVADREDTDLRQHFDECFDFIDEAKKNGGGVLVHCFAGRSRSVTIVVAYLMNKHQMKLSQALEHVKSKRPIVAPNAGFLLQLQNFESSLRECCARIIRRNYIRARCLDDVVEEVGEKNVVQIITDNASNYVLAGKKLMEKRKHLYWTPCAAHCIDLMLEKIGELPQHKTALRKAKKVTKFIYNHGFILSMMRDHCQKEIVRPAATRFGTAYMTLKSMLDVKQPLQAMVVSADWSTSSYATTSEAKKVKEILLDDRVFWESVTYSVKTTGPLFSVLRMTDAERMPAMGFLYPGMEKAKMEIKDALENDLASYNEIIKTIDTKWDKQLHRPIHSVACFLNPHFHYDDSWTADLRVKSGIYTSMERLIPDDDERVKVDLQLDEYKNKRGIFGSLMAKKTAKLKAPADWWDGYGIDTPELRAFAIRVLSLTCSSSACERNWSTFNQIHTKRRNRLSVEKMNALAYIAFNKRLRERHLRKRTVIEDEELMVLDQCPSDDDWIACSDEEGDDDWMAFGVGEGAATQGVGDATQGEGVATQGEGAATQGVGVGRRGRRGVGAATQGGYGRTYARGRKRKTTPGVDAAREKAKGQLRRVEEEEEPIESESETDEGEDERDIPYVETSDDSTGGGDGPSSFDPGFQHPQSDASMFN